MDVRREMQALEGARRNDPDRSILDAGRPKDEIPPECHCGYNCGMGTSFEEGTYGRRYWCCARIYEITSSSEVKQWGGQDICIVSNTNMSTIL